MKDSSFLIATPYPFYSLRLLAAFCPAWTPFPGTPGQATRVYHAGTAGRGPARKKPGGRPADPARLDPATAGKRRRNNPAVPEPKYWGRGGTAGLMPVLFLAGRLPRR